MSRVTGFVNMVACRARQSARLALTAANHDLNNIINSVQLDDEDRAAITRTRADLKRAMEAL